MLQSVAIRKREVSLRMRVFNSSQNHIATYWPGMYTTGILYYCTEYCTVLNYLKTANENETEDRVNVT